MQPCTRTHAIRVELPGTAVADVDPGSANTQGWLKHSHEGRADLSRGMVLTADMALMLDWVSSYSISACRLLDRVRMCLPKHALI